MISEAAGTTMDDANELRVIHAPFSVDMKITKRSLTYESRDIEASNKEFVIRCRLGQFFGFATSC